MTTLYQKIGRRYVVWGYEWDREQLKAGTFRLSYAYKDGGKMYAYDVKPDTAGFRAAAMIAEKAMAEAMHEASKPRPQGTTPYTKKQLAILEKFKEDMMAAGGFIPHWWNYLTVDQVARAGIKAVEEFQP